jgi:prophage antirepressor-like protein
MNKNETLLAFICLSQFIHPMEIVKTFTKAEQANSDDAVSVDIVIRGTPLNPLFRAADIGTVLNIAQIGSTIRNFKDSEKVLLKSSTNSGQQNVLFLTNRGVHKLLLLKSKKAIVNDFQDWIDDIVEEIQLSDTTETKQKEAINLCEQRLPVIYDKERQKMLLSKYGQTASLIYVIRVKSFDDGTYIIKIGESRRGVIFRYNQHKTDYGDILLLDCFKIGRSKDFETFIHNHPDIKPNQVTDLCGHEKARELFLIGFSLSYDRLIEIIEDNISHFYDENEIELNELKTKFTALQKEYECGLTYEFKRNVKQRFDELEQKVENMAHQISVMNAKTTTNFDQPLVTLGPRLQKIDPETFNLVQVYESVAQCIKDSNFKIKRPTIMKAVHEKTIHQGYRWALVDRNDDPSVVSELLGDTRVITIRNIDYIAKLNHSKTEILNVYLDRKSAALENGYKSSGGIDNPVISGALTRGHYYFVYTKVPDHLRIAFENEHGEPLLFKNGVVQLNKEGEVNREFSCKSSCMKAMSISDKTLQRALSTGLPYKGYCYREIGERIAWL